MTLYSDLVGALGATYGSPELSALLSHLPPRENLSRSGGYRGSLTYRDEGLCLIFDFVRPSWIYQSAHIYPGGVEKFKRFAEPLEGRVSLSETRSGVRATLGAPALSGGGERLLVLGVARPWDRYDYPTHSLRLEYSEASEQIYLVSAMSRELVAEMDGARR